MERRPHSALTMLVWRIALVYIVLFLCRAVFYLANAAAIGPLAWSELGQL